MKEEQFAMISMVLNGFFFSNFDCFSLLFDFFLVRLIVTTPIFLSLYLPTQPPTYLLTHQPTHPPTTNHQPTYVFHSLVVMCQNKHVK
jgi:hypothetical protein